MPKMMTPTVNIFPAEVSSPPTSPNPTVLIVIAVM